MKAKCNEDIRQKAKEAGITLCELAFRTQISESTLFQWLRRPLSQEHEKLLLCTIERIKESN